MAGNVGNMFAIVAHFLSSFFFFLPSLLVISNHCTGRKLQQSLMSMRSRMSCRD